MTRDAGLMCEAIFLSEDGPISTTNAHFSFNQSPLLMMIFLEPIGSSVRRAGVEASGTGAAAALEMCNFTCTSLSEAV